MNDNSHIVRNCVIVVGVLLILSTAFIFLAFRTDYIFNVQTDFDVSKVTFERTSVSTVIEEIDDLESGGGKSLVPELGDDDDEAEVKFKDSDGWYADVPSDTKKGTVAGKIDYLDYYNGLPWDADDSVYMYYQHRAKNDIYDILATGGIKRTSFSSNVVNTNDTSLPGQGWVLDGVTCLGVAVSPACINRQYYPARCFKSCKGLDSDDKVKNGTYKMAVVLVKKGEDLEDSSKFLYLPATRADAKAHTFYGGVTQTNIKVVAENKVQVSTDNSGQKNYKEVTIDPKDSLADTLEMLNDTLHTYRIVDGLDMGIWGNNNLETYNLKKEVRNQLNLDYDVVGFVVWGSSL